MNSFSNHTSFFFFMSLIKFLKQCKCFYLKMKYSRKENNRFHREIWFPVKHKQCCNFLVISTPKYERFWVTEAAITFSLTQTDSLFVQAINALTTYLSSVKWSHLWWEKKKFKSSLFTVMITFIVFTQACSLLGLPTVCWLSISGLAVVPSVHTSVLSTV